MRINGVWMDDIEAEFEEQANKLMPPNERGERFPAYTEGQIRRKARREVSIEQVYAEARQMPSASDEMARRILDMIWTDLLCVLTYHQAVVLQGLRNQLTETAMAESLGVSERSIRRYKIEVLRKVRQSADPYWWPWMREVMAVFTTDYWQGRM